MKRTLKNYFTKALTICALTITPVVISSSSAIAKTTLPIKNKLGITVLMPDYEGGMFRANGDLYVVMFGWARHIVDANTLYGVFKKSPTIGNNMLPALKGTPIPSGSCLLEDTSTGMVYFWDQQTAYYITSPAIANKYQLDLKKARKINTIAGYTIGWNLE